MSYTALQQQLKDAVVSSLNSELYDNAAFLCERLHAEIKSEEVKLLLAECYSRQNKCAKAYEVLSDSQSANNRYKLALLSLKLNKLEEAESALLGRKCTQSKLNTKDDKI